MLQPRSLFYHLRDQFIILRTPVTERFNKNPTNNPPQTPDSQSSSFQPLHFDTHTQNSLQRLDVSFRHIFHTTCRIPRFLPILLHKIPTRMPTWITDVCLQKGRCFEILLVDETLPRLYPCDALQVNLAQPQLRFATLHTMVRFRSSQPWSLATGNAPSTTSRCCCSVVSWPTLIQANL
jgi:hypothetical protein